MAITNTLNSSGLLNLGSNFNQIKASNSNLDLSNLTNEQKYTPIYDATTGLNQWGEKRYSGANPWAEGSNFNNANSRAVDAANVDYSKNNQGLLAQLSSGSSTNLNSSTGNTPGGEALPTGINFKPQILATGQSGGGTTGQIDFGVPGLAPMPTDNGGGGNWWDVSGDSAQGQWISDYFKSKGMTPPPINKKWQIIDDPKTNPDMQQYFDQAVNPNEILRLPNGQYVIADTNQRPEFQHGHSEAVRRNLIKAAAIAPFVLPIPGLSNLFSGGSAAGAASSGAGGLLDSAGIGLSDANIAGHLASGAAELGAGAGAFALPGINIAGGAGALAGLSGAAGGVLTDTAGIGLSDANIASSLQSGAAGLGGGTSAAGAGLAGLGGATLPAINTAAAGGSWLGNLLGINPSGAAGTALASLGSVLGGGGGALGGLLGTALSGYLQNQQGKDYADQLKNLQNQVDPFAKYRDQYAQKLNDLYSNPDSIKDTPGYKFSMDQGVEQIRRQNARNGYTGSGNEKYALAEFSQGLASKTWNDEVNRIMTLAGAGNSGQSSQLGLAGLQNSNNTQSGVNSNIMQFLQFLLGSK